MIDPMPDIKGDRLYVRLGPSQVRKRLRGVGYGVRRVETAGTGRTLIIHTATGDHLEELKALFRDVLETREDQA
jgi:hypothetical protein